MRKKSWKSFALAAGFAAVLAPTAVVGPAWAAPTVPTITSTFPASPPPGTNFQANGTNCTSTTQTGATANVEFFGPGNQNLGSRQAVTQNLDGGLFTVTFTVPAAALPGATGFFLLATCSDNTGTSRAGQTFPLTIGLGAGVTSANTTTLSGTTGQTTLSGQTTLTGGTGQTTAGATTAATTAGGGTGGGTTAGGTTTAAPPIVQNPTFTG